MNDICPICLDDSIPMDFTLLCNHQFHSSCIKQWLNISCICPYCRAYVKISFKASLNKYCPLKVNINLYDDYLNIIFLNKLTQRIYYNKIKYLRLLNNGKIIKLEFFKTNGRTKEKKFFIKPKNQTSYFFKILRDKLYNYSIQVE